MPLKPTGLMTIVMAAASLAVLSGAAGTRADAPRLAPGPDQQRVFDVSLTSRAARPRLGLPDFTLPGAAEPALSDAIRTVADVLWDDLNFEREFYLIPRTESASIPLAATADRLPLERWRAIGADFVILGTVVPGADGSFSARVTFVPVREQSPGTQQFSASFDGCTTASPRACAHYMADYIHKQLRDLDGVAQTKLAFVSDRDATRVRTRLIDDSGVSREIYISDYDGANQRPVTANRSLTLAPAWSPDGRTLAYTLWPGVGEPHNVFLNTLDGRSVTPLIPGNGYSNSLPAWSPDGTRLAFSSTRSGNTDVWIVNRDGSGLRQLTNHPADDTSPTWSPTGLQIAFISNRTGGTQLYVVNADGTGLEKLTGDGGDHDRPTWSPLGFIAYTGGFGPSGHNISVYDLATGQIRVLTDGLGENGSPSIAPNGRHIAFATTRWGREQIAVINLRGENLKRVTSEGNNKSPSWSRTRGR